MLPIKVSHQTLRNIEALQATMKTRTSQINLHRINPSEQIYSIWVNAKTAEMIFLQTVDPLKVHTLRQENPPQGYRRIDLIVKKKDGKLHFDYIKTENVALEALGFDWTATKIMQETLATLNVLGEVSSSSLQETTVEEKPETAPGWVGWKNRINAEKLLKNQAVGTYVLRKNPSLFQAIEQALKAANPSLIDCYIATVVKKEKQIGDITFIYTKMGWDTFKDTPNLLNPVYTYKPTFHFLMRNLREVLRIPLLLPASEAG